MNERHYIDPFMGGCVGLAMMMSVRCPDCRNNVSSAAPSCPHCGGPIKPPTHNSMKPINVRDSVPKRTPGHMCGIGILALLVIFESSAVAELPTTEDGFFYALVSKDSKPDGSASSNLATIFLDGSVEIIDAEICSGCCDPRATSMVWDQGEERLFAATESKDGSLARNWVEIDPSTGESLVLGAMPECVAVPPDQLFLGYNPMDGGIYAATNYYYLLMKVYKNTGSIAIINNTSGVRACGLAYGQKPQDGVHGFFAIGQRALFSCDTGLFLLTEPEWGVMPIGGGATCVHDGWRLQALVWIERTKKLWSVVAPESGRLDFYQVDTGTGLESLGGSLALKRNVRICAVAFVPPYDPATDVPVCKLYDHDGNGAVNLRDFRSFQNCFGDIRDGQKP